MLQQATNRQDVEALDQRFVRFLRNFVMHPTLSLADSRLLGNELLGTAACGLPFYLEFELNPLCRDSI